MDVNAKRNTSGVITDNAQTVGLQAPRLTRLELSSLTATYGTNQNGALIYVTDIAGGNTTGQRINVTTPGYYYFDSVANVWQKFVAGNIPATTTEPWKVGNSTNDATVNNQNIYQSGFIGISQANPTYFQSRGIPRALSIVGDGNASDDIQIQAFTGNVASSSGQVALMKTRGTVGAALPVVTGDGLGTLVFGGNVATGANPNYIESASIKGIVNGTVSATSLPADLQFNTGTGNEPSEKMRITSTGNLGIGVTSPSEKLHVVGQTRISSLANTSNKIVIADSQGVLKLQEASVPPPNGFINQSTTAANKQLTIYEGKCYDPTQPQSSCAVDLVHYSSCAGFLSPVNTKIIVVNRLDFATGLYSNVWEPKYINTKSVDNEPTEMTSVDTNTYRYLGNGYSLGARCYTDFNTTVNTSNGNIKIISSKTNMFTHITYLSSVAANQ
ncbi:hypothetical protein [Chryseobacterium sp. OV279]|uniref:hypothetical protein n=1 Tax=Chryseobacterium sp. OV279 TaxID=1500285 RepID=UPI00091498C0|nr:hypothetical protein [Chryseobacterium sp. OV279]SHG89527.1 hypothetical protein SAMN02787100_4890 [Chryseobacterium sp. OV279]